MYSRFVESFTWYYACLSKWCQNAYSHQETLTSLVDDWVLNQDSATQHFYYFSLWSTLVPHVFGFSTQGGVFISRHKSQARVCAILSLSAPQPRSSKVCDFLWSWTQLTGKSLSLQESTRKPRGNNNMKLPYCILGWWATHRKNTNSQFSKMQMQSEKTDEWWWIGNDSLLLPVWIYRF